MSQTHYDPDAPEGAKDFGSQYLSRKDLKFIIPAVIIVVVAMTMLFPVMKQGTDAAACKQNMNKISMAIKIYAESNDGRLPPLYNVGENGTPQLTNDKPIVWASVIGELPRGSNFYCPSAKKEEYVRVNGKSLITSMFESKDKTVRHIDLTYGMFSALSARALSDVANNDQTVLIAETSNYGANNTYNPLPFELEDGTPVPFDGFAIGFDDSQVQSTANSKLVTRLAFPNTASGNFTTATEGRHKSIIHTIFVDGHLGKLSPDRAQIKPGDFTWLVR